MTVEDLRGRLEATRGSIQVFRTEELKLLRQIARGEGELADNPATLFEGRNLAFREQERNGLRKAFGYEGSAGMGPPIAQAYYCNACEGWLKGPPRRETYDEMGATAGSMGIRSFCWICDTKLNDTVLVRS